MNNSLNNPLRIAVIGAGVRGTALSRKISSSEFPARIVAVAEPDDEKRKSFTGEFDLQTSAIFNTWESLTTNLNDCDAAIIATLDNQHAGPVIECINRGWHVLVEKPLADNIKDCILIDNKRTEKKRVVAVCHSLRFMDGFLKIKQLLECGTIGQLVHIDHMEGIGHFRFVHNYVRGRWSREKNNTFLLLHKCSHDIDYLNWLIKEPCLKVTSFGSLTYFTEKNAPTGSTYRCIDNCKVKDTCPYSALNIYVEGLLDKWPANDISRIHTKTAHMEAITNGPYGICAWHANNDVVDHQVVIMEFKGGTTATCTMTGYSATNGRRTRLQGTLGEILYDEALGSISVKKFSGKEHQHIKIPEQSSYHPEDQAILDNWISAIQFSTPVAVDSSEALRTLTVVFASEISRKENRLVELSEFLK
jgi:predicted dehydrogenase